MSTNNCCCVHTPTTVEPKGPCVDSETIMSQTGLITDCHCGIKPVVGEILGVKMQSSNLVVSSGLGYSQTAYGSSAEPVVFGYVLSANTCDVGYLAEQGPVYKPNDCYKSASPNSGNACYWIWWTKNRCLELDQYFPSTNFAGCIEQDNPDYMKEPCGPYPDRFGGAYAHDGRQCFSSSIHPGAKNLYAPGGDFNYKTLYKDTDKGMLMPDNMIPGRACCSGWDIQNCNEVDTGMQGHNEVGTYTNDDWSSVAGGYGYPVLRSCAWNPKYPASIEGEAPEGFVFERKYAVWTYSCSNLVGNHCWREDNQCPATISVNGLTPYQRRVAEERSPDIWEIHEFNNTNPIKIKFLGQSTVDFPAELKVWGIIPSGYNTWEGVNDGVGYTDISAKGSNLCAVQQNHNATTYIDNSGDNVVVNGHNSRRVRCAPSTSDMCRVLPGAQIMTCHANQGKTTLDYPYPTENYIKNVSTGFVHAVCTRDNDTAEVSKNVFNLNPPRQYYANSIPTAFKLSTYQNSFDYGQIDVPYSPGSYGITYDWISHNNSCGCTGTLFSNISAITTHTGYACEDPNYYLCPTGSCRFGNTNLPINGTVDVSCKRDGTIVQPDGTILFDQCSLPNMSWGVLYCDGKAPLSSCAAVLQPEFCKAGYPPLHCGDATNGRFVCGTGGFNTTLHLYKDYRAYECTNLNVSLNQYANYDINYCEGVQQWKQISAGAYHNIAINKSSTFGDGLDQEFCVENGTYKSPEVQSQGIPTNVVGWGAGSSSNSSYCLSDNYPHFGQANIPPGLGICKKVSAGSWHSLAIKQDDTVDAWGAGENVCPCIVETNMHHFGQSRVPEDLGAVKEISAGEYHSCVIKEDGHVVCWGAGTSIQLNGGVCGVNWGQSMVPENLGRCSKISAGGFHTCAIKTDGKVVCWGKNDNGQCTPPETTSVCIQISCGTNFSAARYRAGYENYPYYSAHNHIGYLSGPHSLFTYFFAFASVEFTYAKATTPETKRVCERGTWWSKSLPAAYHQRSDAVHMFSFETYFYGGNEDLMEERWQEYTFANHTNGPYQLSVGPWAMGGPANDDRWKETANRVNQLLYSPEYWKHRMSCKDWREDVWDDMSNLQESVGGIGVWDELDALLVKYYGPGIIKPLGAYRLPGDVWEIRSALDISAAPPSLAKMARGNVNIPSDYWDDLVDKYTLQVNADIYNLVQPDSIELTLEAQNMFNRLRYSIYFRPKPIEWSYSGMDWAVTLDWPSLEIASTSGGARSWRYSWLWDRRRTVLATTITDKSDFIMSVGPGQNFFNETYTSQPWWNTLNKMGYIGSTKGGLALSVNCDWAIGPSVAYTGTSSVYAARHIPGINTKLNSIGVDGYTYYYPKTGTAVGSCSLFNVIPN